MASAKSYLLSLCEKQAWDDVRTFLKGDGKKASKVKKEQLTFTSAEGLTSLAHACLEEVMDVIELLLKVGADPMAADPDGTNCLHIAATLSNGKMLKLLLEKASKKPDVNAADKAGSAPLHLAVEPADPADAAAAAECVTILLGAGANAAAKNGDGEAPMALASLEAIRAVLQTAVGKKGAGRRGAGRKGEDEGAAEEKESSG